ncbi:MAG: hypothetical protein N4A45_00585 [Flavobacteriales bacterium]|nr:hypothetical protein [Flavobacteriales bacterium]
MNFRAYFGYIEKLGGNGWLRVRMNDGFIWPLPEFLKIRVTKSSNREEFEILEGRFKGKKASVLRKGITLQDFDGSFFEDYLKSGYPYKRSAELIFNIKAQKLCIEGLGYFNATTQISNPPALGKHDIEIPYEPHPKGEYYTNRAKYAKTWFRLGHSGERFLHCGNISAGCVTVKDIDSWDRIYQYLILSRKGTRSVGTIEVIEQ